MATVYKAYQPSLRRNVAIKVLPEFFAKEPGFKERFEQEAVSVANLRHPNIPAVFDYGEQDNIAFIATEFIGGGSLDARMGKPHLVSEVVAVLGPVASALDYAHSVGVLHRDVKPSNVLLTQAGSPVLTDFGLARMMETKERLTQTGAVLGTPEYMAPEVCEGQDALAASDQYALGVMAYEMLTGRVPFTAATPMGVIVAQVQRPLPLPRSLNPDLSEGVEEALLKALAKDPNHRFETCTAFVKALEVAPAAQVVQSIPAAPVVVVPKDAKRATSRRSRTRLTWTAGGLALLLILGGAGAYFALHPAAKKTASTTTPSPPAIAPSALGSPSPIPSPRVAVPVRFLVWQANLKGNGNDIFGFPNIPDASAASISYPVGAVVLSVLSSTGSVSAAWNCPLVKTYLMEYDVAFSPGSSSHAFFVLAGGGPGGYQLNLDLNQGSYDVSSYDSTSGNTDTSTVVDAPGLRTGRTLTFSMLVEANRITIYIDGTQAIQIPAPNLGAIATSNQRGGNLNDLRFALDNGTGTMTISRVQVWALPI
jgi:serine/threonine protein kinase